MPIFVLLLELDKLEQNYLKLQSSQLNYSFKSLKFCSIFLCSIADRCM
ncbi:hypothetical protein CULT_2270002 [[Clostridium] ultunense Esp]|nr:hypothetical protein CULT_2270002 [[Clostridium] ultunense Esp]